MDRPVHAPPRDLLILSRIPRVGLHRLRFLVETFRDTDRIFRASPRELLSANGVDRTTAATIASFLRSGKVQEAERFSQEQLKRLGAIGGKVLTFWDESYPSLLRRIHDPPPYLFVRGEVLPCDATSCAIVGTRSPSAYGAAVAEKFADGLACHRITVVSGLARGIDTHAHHAALCAGGRTIAVIGSGVDVIYPGENAQLARKIMERGAIMSEFEMGAKPDAVNFPRRNRIVSGMALGTLVVETRVEGGAMITAALALDQGREVFAVPSAISAREASGTNRLIKEGRALLTESPDDIVRELAPRLTTLAGESLSSAPVAPSGLSLFEQRCLEFLGNEPMHIDLIADLSGLSAVDAMVHLLSLEVKGVIRQVAGKRFLRI